jgi:hypothetical protein
VTEPSDTAPRQLRLRYPAVCANCGLALSPGAEAIWDPATKKATCLACAPPNADPDPGTAGASAAAEGRRRKEKRVENVRRQYGDYAASVADAMAERDTAASWGKGSSGESRLAAFVMREVGDAVIPIHDRLIPGTRGNIDHIFVAQLACGSWTPRPTRARLSSASSAQSGGATTRFMLAAGIEAHSRKASRSRWTPSSPHSDPIRH